ncbi:serine protease [Flavobacterium sp. Sd200]|uniref:trypsin-like peptidase domain-containing protein n=1 Tax=Flavobacterium sp. Sd200 TaxID=2692211 RepID=UPI001370146F|nr:trypsin-like peptidase domain-containing protein [Flavobacterium sp. Sd200]MXN92873.1 serine protease [Flavobacterium sp. Sd200]
MALLTDQEERALVNALNAGMDVASNRAILWQFIDYRFKSIVPLMAAPYAQLTTDIGRLNNIERLSDGSVPLQTYLQNALPFLFGSGEQEQKVRAILDLVNGRAVGAPKLLLSDLHETKEQIIHTDDTVGFGFIEAGFQSASSVFKLKVKSYLNGQARKLPNGNDMFFLGTGWLLADDLIITNHHVVNARKDNEVKATDDDLRLQGSETQVILDYDYEEIPANNVISALRLEAWNEELDYAVLRIASSGRKPLQIAPQMVNYDGTAVPVNIIQHPGGRSKRYGIRNNLVSASTDTDLRYFTDTEGGSSGSPVLDDKWRVVALHKSSIYVTNVQFQGKPTAYVNSGTHFQLIIRHLKTNFSAIAQSAGL